MHPIDQLATRQLEDLRRLIPGTVFGEAGIALSLDDAYRVQDRITALRCADGEHVGGYKLGCLGPKIRQTFGMDGPIRGTLFGNEFHRSGISLSCGEFANLAIEGELAVRVGSDGEPVSVFPVIELHHFVLRSEPRLLQELIANNGLNAGVILPAVESERVAAEATVAVEINGQVLDHAALWGFAGGLRETLDWLHDHLAANDRVLQPGQIVLAGTQGGMYPVAPGDSVRVGVAGCERVELDLLP